MLPHRSRPHDIRRVYRIHGEGREVIKVKEFTDESNTGEYSPVNCWLEENSDRIKVIEIKYTLCEYSGDLTSGILVVYEEV